MHLKIFRYVCVRGCAFMYIMIYEYDICVCARVCVYVRVCESEDM